MEAHLVISPAFALCKSLDVFKGLAHERLQPFKEQFILWLLCCGLGFVHVFVARSSSATERCHALLPPGASHDQDSIKHVTIKISSARTSTTMGRARTKQKLQTKATEAKNTPQPSVPALLEKAQELLTHCDYDLTLRFARRILEQEPNHVAAREIMGIALLETGDLGNAKEVLYAFSVQIIVTDKVLQVFESLLPPSPNAPSPSPPTAYLYLAQLCEDDPKLALQHYCSAVTILQNQLKGKERASDGPSDEAEVKNNLVRALIGQVEIWMDPSYDLWYVESILCG